MLRCRPLLQAAATIAGLKIELHAGGLWMGSRRQPMGEALRDYVRPHDQRIEALTGQHFGERYFNELLLREGCLLDSEPPIRAVLAVTALGAMGWSCCTGSSNPTIVTGSGLVSRHF